MAVGNPLRIIHILNESGKHPICLASFALEGLHNIVTAFGRHDINLDLVILSEAPEATNQLIILFVAVGWKENRMGAVLPVQPPRPDSPLCNDASDVSFPKSGKSFFFRLDRIRT